MKWLVILLTVLASLILILFALTVFFFRVAICRKDRYDEAAMLKNMKKTMSPEHYAIIEAGVKSFHAAEKEDVHITSHDGLRLHGYLIEQKDRDHVRGTIILVHGWHGKPQVDFSASWHRYYEMGLDILAIEQRAHGKSEGKYICFGVKERFDLLDWISFVNNRYGADKKIVLSGISMGSATVLMTLGEEQLPSNVVCATADCGYTDAWDQFAHVLRRSYHLPGFPLLYTTDLFSRAVADFPFRSYSTIESLKKAKIPVLFIHGKADGFVPLENTTKNAAACASYHEVVEIENAPHGLSYLFDTPTISRAFDEFVGRMIG